MGALDPHGRGRRKDTHSCRCSPGPAKLFSMFLDFVHGKIRGFSKFASIAPSSLRVEA